MAEIVIGIGMSHSPMIVADGPMWRRFGEVDRVSRLLFDTAGKQVTFDELERANESRYAAEAELENLIRQSNDSRSAIERLRSDFADAEPDVVVVVGDDQMELFRFDNLPALAIFYGNEWVTCVRDAFGPYRDMIRDMGEVFRGFGMDEHHTWPGCEPLALHLIRSLVDRGFDLGALREVAAPERAGVGHAFGVVETQLMGDEKLPLVPVYVNNYYPPNQVPPSRCYDFGRALRDAVEAFPEDLRVAIVASGGLSHFVTDAALDQLVLAALKDGDEQRLRELPGHLLNSGNSEIRNWVAVGAACEDKQIVWDEYIPVYRTAAGTGCGLAYARWS